MTVATEWVAVDWGTSNLRAWGIAADGAVSFAKASPEGMGRLSPDQFAGVLDSLVASELPENGRPVDALICGMAGARQGWIEAPYIEAPADLGGLAYSAVHPPQGESRLAARILPGVCQKRSGAEDVMRGEETQLLGLSALMPGFSGVAILPGTHSKWAWLGGRRIERFATAMTGELYELLKTHSVLRLSLAGEIDQAERSAGTSAGLAMGIEWPERLASLLFKVRAGALLSGRSPGWSAGFLSGLLIGAEIGGQRDWIAAGQQEIPLIGGAGLAAIYAEGLALLGATGRTVDATSATLAGLKLARSLA
ncbi:MAG TPA: 2-dehydro-3-deoxygalactonokinase [Devosia sp.]|nr:2-dehydro-3-deoxygalactonokinase [Devosia sp.]